MPTYNRPQICLAKLRFLKEAGCSYRIIVADSSDDDEASKVRAACEGFADYLRFDSKLSLCDKLALVASEITTPYVLPSADDDICLLDALDALLDRLDNAPEVAAADGYTLNYGVNGSDFDIHGVSFYTPSVTDPDPLQRLYHLVRRYQPFFFSVIRTDAWIAALNIIQPIDSAAFEEVCMMSVITLQGGVVRVPVVLHLRGMERSLSPVTDSHPFYWFLNDAQSFFHSYAQLRETISQFIRDSDIPIPDGTNLTQLLNLIYATWLGREVDVGMINHSTRLLLGDQIPPIAQRGEYRWLEPGADDVVHPVEGGSRRYIWRHEVVAAEPRDEICLDAEEITRVERQLDSFQLL